MSVLNRVTKLFYSPDDIPAITQPLSANDMLDELSKDEPEILDLDDKSKKETKGDKEEKDEKVSEEDEEEGKEKSLEDELEEELADEDEVDDEKLELALPVSKKAILAKYPNIFKDFPDLEKSYYRERAFSELLPTPADAKEAVEARDILNSFEVDLHKGNVENILASVKQKDTNAFYKIVDNYLPNLAKVDKDAYHHVVGNVIKSTIIQMIQEGKSSSNETLEVAAQILNQFVFASSKFEPITNLSGTDDSKEDPRLAEIDKREKAITEREFNRSLDSINKRCENAIKSTLDKNIDPKNSMTDYVKGVAIDRAQKELNQLIDKDTRFKGILDQLWKRAADNNFSVESTDKIKNTYLSKAKSLLPALIKKHRNEALKGLGKRVVDDSDDDRDRKGPLPAGKPRTSTSSSNRGTSGNSDKEKARSIPSNVRSVDYLMQD